MLSVKMYKYGLIKILPTKRNQALALNLKTFKTNTSKLAATGDREDPMQVAEFGTLEQKVSESKTFVNKQLVCRSK